MKNIFHQQGLILSVKKTVMINFLWAVILVSVGYNLVIQPKWNQWVQTQKTTQLLAEKFAQQQQQVQALNKNKLELPPSLAEIITLINLLSEKQGLYLQRITPITAEHRITLQIVLQGKFHAFVNFLQELTQAKFLWHLAKLQINPLSANASQLKFSLELSIFSG